MGTPYEELRRQIEESYAKILADKRWMDTDIRPRIDRSQLARLIGPPAGLHSTMLREAGARYEEFHPRELDFPRIYLADRRVWEAIRDDALQLKQKFEDIVKDGERSDGTFEWAGPDANRYRHHLPAQAAAAAQLIDFAERSIILLNTAGSGFQGLMTSLASLNETVKSVNSAWLALIVSVLTTAFVNIALAIVAFIVFALNYYSVLAALQGSIISYDNARAQLLRDLEAPINRLNLLSDRPDRVFHPGPQWPDPTSDTSFVPPRRP
jgi:hypothetical protein